MIAASILRSIDRPRIGTSTPPPIFRQWIRSCQLTRSWHLHRVHRLGQLKQVEIIRLLAENTIDEHIFKVRCKCPRWWFRSSPHLISSLVGHMQMAQQKKKLSEALLAEGSYVNEKSDMDVKDILKALLFSLCGCSISADLLTLLLLLRSIDDIGVRACAIPDALAGPRNVEAHHRQPEELQASRGPSQDHRKR